MRILKFTFAVFFLSFTFISFAQEKPYLIIEDNDGQYDVFLKIDNMNDVASVDVVGSYTSNGATEDLALNISQDGVAQFNKDVVLIHSLNKEVNSSAASYMVLLTNAAGEVTGFPIVKVNVNGSVLLACSL